MRNSHATSNFVASGQVWLHLNGRDVVQLSYSSSNCYHLALQLLPQRLTSSPFALLSRGERAEVLRFLPMMEVGNRCGVRCFHKSVQCFFFLKLDILKIVEKIWFFVTYNMPPFQKMQIDDIWNLLLWTFFKKKRRLCSLKTLRIGILPSFWKMCNRSFYRSVVLAVGVWVLALKFRHDFNEWWGGSRSSAVSW